MLKFGRKNVGKNSCKNSGAKMWVKMRVQNVSAKFWQKIERKNQAEKIGRKIVVSDGHFVLAIFFCHFSFSILGKK